MRFLCAFTNDMTSAFTNDMIQSQSLHLATAVDLAEGPRPHHEEVGEIVIQA